MTAWSVKTIVMIGVARIVDQVKNPTPLAPSIDATRTETIRPTAA